jgi:hypothetical protein
MTYIITVHIHRYWILTNSLDIIWRDKLTTNSVMLKPIL